MNESAFLKRVELSRPEEFSSILKTEEPHEVAFLVRYFGRSRFQRMRAAASVLRADATAHRGIVVVLPGILGSELWEQNECIWKDIWSILKGDFDQLQVKDDGTSRKPIDARSALKDYYGEIQQKLPCRRAY